MSSDGTGGAASSDEPGGTVDGGDGAGAVVPTEREQVIAEMVALIEGRADSLYEAERWAESYEARNCALAIRRAA
jgi:hypothetical protein